MRWFKPGLRNSLSALLGPDLPRDYHEALEPVRQAMIDALGADGSRLNPALGSRLRYLHDAHALWYARAEVVATLSRLYGEAEAVQRVQRLNPVFQGLVPSSLINAGGRSRSGR